MKYRNLILLFVGSLFFTLSACQSSPASQPAPTAANPSQQQNPPINIPSPTPERKAEIVAEIKQIASDFNKFVENEKKTGNIQIVALPNGTTGFTFYAESYPKVTNEYTKVAQKIEDLNNEYYQIYKEERGSVPTMTPSSKEDQKARLAILTAEFGSWLKNEEKSGTTVTMYNLIKYTPIFIGESYAKEQEKSDEINTLRLSLNGISDESKQLDIQQIQKIEPGNVTLIDIGAFPYYRSDINLTTYETGTTVYNVYSPTHQIIEILPKEFPQGVTASSVADLEKIAREVIAKFAPDVNLDSLTPAGGAKEGTYFFRWEDQTKPLLDDGRSYPFIQVGLNGNGELLNYYNTLPLAR